MKNISKIFAVGSLVSLLVTTSSAFAAPKTYQVTGPVLETSDSVISVQKGKDRWDIAKTPATKITGDAKVGSKVTVEYTMTAVTVEAKAGKAEKAAK